MRASVKFKVILFFTGLFGLTLGVAGTRASQKCPQFCQCDPTQLAIFCSGELDHVPSPLPTTYVQLRILDTKLAVLGTESPPLPQLRYLEVVRNKYLTLVNHKWLSGLVNLEVLDLSGNRLDSVGFSPFSQLHHLNLSHNRISHLSALDIPTLSYLDLSHNQLDHFSELHNLQNLSSLDLSSNNFTLLRPSWFKNLLHLHILDLSRNSLGNISNVIFWTLSELVELDLSRNRITSVGLLSFRNLNKLEKLDLSRNLLGNLQEGCFKSLVSLKSLDLSHNPLHSLDNLFLSQLQLGTLRLENMKLIEKLTPASFIGLEALEELYVANGSLALLEMGSISPLSNLKHLDLSHNHISTLVNHLFEPLSNLRFLDLRYNPWRCDCHLYWLFLWLGKNLQTHLILPDSTTCVFPGNLKEHPLLESLDHQMDCVNATIKHYSPLARYRMGTTALLQCNVDGSPKPSLAWFTPQGKLLKFLPSPLLNSSEDETTIDTLVKKYPNASFEETRLTLLENGNLIISDLKKGDNGFYHCVASNPMGNSIASVRVTLDYDFLTHVKIMSLFVGLGTSCGFLLLTLIIISVFRILGRCGIDCPCEIGGTSPKTQQIRRILESMEHYKGQQLERLRDNYNFQVQRIKDNCLQQMEKLRESYSGQIEHLRNIRDYGNLQIDRIRDNYYSQVQRVRDYSTLQIDRLRENYIFQRNRIRKFSTHQLYKLRENYKLQQQHINKILENLNLENCRNVCARTDSIIFEPEFTMEADFAPSLSPLQRPDSMEISSQASAYYTPDEANSDASDDLETEEILPPRMYYNNDDEIVVIEYNRSTATLEMLAAAALPVVAEPPAEIIESKEELELLEQPETQV